MALPLLLSLSTACAGVLRAPDDGGSEWSRGSSAHLYVETDIGPRAAEELARDLEFWRMAMTAALFERARAPRERLEVIALRIGELASLSPSLLGAFGRVGPNNQPTLVLGPAEPDNQTEIIRHELAHAVVEENLNDVPRWLNEGLASLLATAELEEKKGAVSWGRLEIHGVHIYHYDLAPVANLVDGAWPAYDMGRYEFSSAYLVRMLAAEHPHELKCLLDHLAGTEGYAAAMKACFPEGTTSWSALYVREQFRKDPIVGRVQLDARAADHAVTVRAMSNADVHGALAQLRDVVAGTMPLNDPRRAQLYTAADQERERAYALGAPRKAAVSPSCYLGAKPEPEGVATGSVPDADIVDVVTRHRTQLLACYDSRMRQRPFPSGKVTIQFSVGADGRVKWSRLVSSTAKDAILETSVGQLLCAWQFPAPSGGDEVRVTYPFEFSYDAPPADGIK
jgi:TonB family protein